MIIVRTPFRISFGGGGSDIEDFYKNSEGAVLSTTINKYLYTAIHPNFDSKSILLKYSTTESVHNPKKIKNGIARAILSEYKINGVEIETIGDIPSGTGLGSSSAFAVGLHQAVLKYLNKSSDKELLASKACNTEIKILKSPIGKQDQYASAYGGLNLIRFLKNGEVVVQKINIDRKKREKFEQSLLLFYLGVTRSANTILNDQKKNIKQMSEVSSSLKNMVEIAYKMKYSIEEGDIASFGKLLHENWILKKSLSTGISNSEIDYYYDKAIKAGAYGGKVTGAGGGGFLLLTCEKNKQDKLRDELKDLRELSFSFSDEGSEIIFGN